MCVETPLEKYPLTPKHTRDISIRKQMPAKTQSCAGKYQPVQKLVGKNLHLTKIAIVEMSGQGKIILLHYQST